MLWASLEGRSRTNSPRQRFQSQLCCKIVRYFCWTLYSRINLKIEKAVKDNIKTYLGLWGWQMDKTRWRQYCLGGILSENIKFMYVLSLKPHRLGNCLFSSTEIEETRYSLDGWRHRDIGGSKPSTVITNVGKLSLGQLSQRWIFQSLSTDLYEHFFF